jgi:predicted short-subunit dehydrogenase-like oxidoreductase (DUF2520 family)
MPAKRKLPHQAIVSGKAEGQPRTISVIGAGRLGTALSIALAQSGYRVEAIVSRSRARALRAALLVPSKPLALEYRVLDRLPQSQTVLIATPDGTIPEVSRRFAESVQGSNRGRTALHVSGALPSTVLADLTLKGFSVGSVHPLVSVSEAVSGAQALRGARFTVEGDPRAQRVAREMVAAMGAKSFSIKTSEKALYHAAAVMSAGNVVALFDIATEMLSRTGLSQAQSRELLLGLLESTVRNLKAQKPEKALTGPFARGDIETSSQHIAALKAASLYDASKTYVLLGKRSIDLARTQGLPEPAALELEQLLDDFEAELSCDEEPGGR